MLIYLDISRCNILFCLPTTVRGHKKWVWIFHFPSVFIHAVHPSCLSSLLSWSVLLFVLLFFLPLRLIFFTFPASSSLIWNTNEDIAWTKVLYTINWTWPLTILLPFFHFFRLETLLLDSNFFSQVMLPLLPFRCQRDISYHHWSNHFYRIKVLGMWIRIKVVHIGSILPCPCKIPEGGDFSVRRAVQDLYFDGSYSFARDLALKKLIKFRKTS